MVKIIRFNYMYYDFLYMLDIYIVINDKNYGEFKTYENGYLSLKHNYVYSNKNGIFKNYYIRYLKVDIS